MIFFTHYRNCQKIKAELYQIIESKIDLKNKKLAKLKKTDLDSIELMTLTLCIEQRWGKISLAELYQAYTFDDVVQLISKIQS